MKLHSGLLLFFLLFCFTESMVRIVANKQHRIFGEGGNYKNFIRRGENNISELSKQTRKSDNTSEKGKKAIFGDIIKNITRVNNVLEELIKNYEKLRHIYTSQETFEQHEPELDTTDMEIDENYKQMKIRAKETSDVVTRNPNRNTEMFFDGEENEEENQLSDDNNEDYKKHDNMLYDKKDIQKKREEKRTPNIEFLKESTRDIFDSETVDTTTRDPLSAENDNVSSDTISGSVERGTKDNEIKEKIKKFTPEIELKLDNVKLVAEDSIVDMGKKYSPVVKTVIKAEQYSPKFWEKLAQNEPIHLRTQNEITYGKGMQKKYYSNADIAPSKREEKDKTGAVHVKRSSNIRSIVVSGVSEEKGPVKKTLKFVSTKITNGTTQIQPSKIKLPTDSIDWSVENDKTIEKEQFKTSILRKAYGDACLKVVVKKCYKACKQLTKSLNAKYDWKQDFIDSFKKCAKTGCIAEFGDETVAVRQNKKKDEDKDDENYDFVDITRNGYLASACLPSKSRSKEMAVVQRTIGNVKISPRGHHLNILRDRFELACQKASAEKCKRACYFATSKVCSKYSCKVGKKSSLARGCRAQCKTAYRYKEDNKSDDSDSSILEDDNVDTDDSSSISDDGESEPDSDFEAYLNSTTKLKYKKKTT